MKVIILAGGGGTRLFPLSRTCFPKQFLKVEGDKSLLSQTILRFLPITQPSDIIIVTNREYVHHVNAELGKLNIEGVHVVLEPAARNTAPAIALAVKYCNEMLGTNNEEVFFVTPADHVIHPVDQFIQCVEKAITLAESGKIVTFGITPDKPETGYGYIQTGGAIKDGFMVSAFREKPDYNTAERYLSSGDYYWNSGMFVFKAERITAEFGEYQPEIYELMTRPFAKVVADFEQMPNISFDYAIAEKSDSVALVPFSAYWNDIGSWDAIHEVLPKDANGNAIQGDCLPIGCSNSLLLGSSRLIAGIGLKDILVVETGDVILVAHKGESQKVKDLVQELKRQGRKEASEHITMYRPWGSYTILGEGPGYKMKKIVVTPGQQLSLQLHYHRSEHWVVIGGTAKVRIGAEERMVHKNESVFIPPSTKHRLENPGKLPLEIIEVQNGDYLEEDDIVRFEDVYGRA